jgi:hypothetical protein
VTGIERSLFRGGIPKHHPTASNTDPNEAGRSTSIRLTSCGGMAGISAPCPWSSDAAAARLDPGAAVAQPLRDACAIRSSDNRHARRATASGCSTPAHPLVGLNLAPLVISPEITLALWLAANVLLESKRRWMKASLAVRTGAGLGQCVSLEIEGIPTSERSRPRSMKRKDVETTVDGLTDRQVGNASGVLCRRRHREGRLGADRQFFA